VRSRPSSSSTEQVANTRRPPGATSGAARAKRMSCREVSPSRSSRRYRYSGCRRHTPLPLQGASTSTASKVPSAGVGSPSPHSLVWMRSRAAPARRRSSSRARLRTSPATTWQPRSASARLLPPAPAQTSRTRPSTAASVATSWLASSWTSQPRGSRSARRSELGGTVTPWATSSEARASTSAARKRLTTRSRGAFRGSRMPMRARSALAVRKASRSSPRVALSRSAPAGEVPVRQASGPRARATSRSRQRAKSGAVPHAESQSTSSGSAPRYTIHPTHRASGVQVPSTPSTSAPHRMRSRCTSPTKRRSRECSARAWRSPDRNVALARVGSLTTARCRSRPIPRTRPGVTALVRIRASV
jgi:hypothetical protein